MTINLLLVSLLLAALNTQNPNFENSFPSHVKYLEHAFLLNG